MSIVRPGDSTRILCVKDVVRPGCKVRGDDLGMGRRHGLNNVVVVPGFKVVCFQEDIIDMCGAGAPCILIAQEKSSF